MIPFFKNLEALQKSTPEQKKRNKSEQQHRMSIQRSLQPASVPQREALLPRPFQFAQPSKLKLPSRLNWAKVARRALHGHYKAYRPRTAQYSCCTQAPTDLIINRHQKRFKFKPP